MPFLTNKKMKKIQSILLMMLAVCMSVSLQSCNKDDDVSELYSLEAKITDQGTLPDDAYELMQDRFESNTQVSYASLDKAKEALDIAVNTQKGSIQAALQGNTYKFTISYILYNAKGAAVYKIDLKIDGENLTIVK